MKTTILSNNYPLILFISLFFLFNQADCSRKKDLPRYYLTDELKEYAIFEEGTYWVYQNQKGLIDTVKVMEVKTSFAENFDIEHESIKIKTSSNISGEINYTSKVSNNFADLENGSCSAGNTLHLSNSNHVVFMCCCNENSSFPITHLESVVVNSVNYINVIGYQRGTFTNDTLNPTSYYYAKNIGLIKKEQQGVFNWELIDYHIIQ